ncbi:unnamed protein product [Durusdinium trenchii]|uniref:Uncharacterized protein n=1 Tax=Durusdinium trenchii TaxID=1381693 RepID=A0ABP0JN23_9DINO
MYCQKDTDKCNPCAGKRPRPEKPDGSYDTAGAITAIAEGGMSAFRSKFIDNGFITMSGWGYVGAGVMDGVLGVMEAGEPDSAAWNVYKLESYISEAVDYMICEFKEILGDYFAAYMGSTQLCNYNIGIDSMAAEWKDNCRRRQCLNYTDLPSDERGDCCTVQTGAADVDCEDASHEDIKQGQAFCRLNGEFSPGTGVCSPSRRCLQCMTFEMAIEDTKEQINLYKTYPTNWGAALEGYSNVDAIIALCKGTMMMVTFYQELVLLGGIGSMGNFQSFCSSSYDQLKTKIDHLMNSASQVVEDSSCTYGDDVEFCVPSSKCSPTGGLCMNEGWTACPATFKKPVCIFTRMGCSRPYSMLGSSYCLDAGNAFCAGDADCNVDACYFACMEQDGNCNKYVHGVFQHEKKAATQKLKEIYTEQLQAVAFNVFWQDDPETKMLYST